VRAGEREGERERGDVSKIEHNIAQNM